MRRVGASQASAAQHNSALKCPLGIGDTAEAVMILL